MTQSQFNVYTNSDGEEVIGSLLLRDVYISYPYLVAPRPALDSNGKPDPTKTGKYGAELLITNPDDLELVQQYLDYVFERDSHMWGNKIPKNLHMPLREADYENSLEEQVQALLVLKSKSKNQPDLWIRPEGEEDAYKVSSEEDLDEIYAGMVADVFIAISGYPGGNAIKPGLSIWLNAVCKTGDGIPISGRVDREAQYQNAFSLPGSKAHGFAKPKQKAEAVEEAKEEDTEPTNAFSLKNLKPKAKEEAQEEAAPKVDLSKLVKTKTSTPPVKEEEAPAPTSTTKMTLSQMLSQKK